MRCERFICDLECGLPRRFLALRLFIILNLPSVHTLWIEARIPREVKPHPETL